MSLQFLPVTCLPSGSSMLSRLQRSTSAAVFSPAAKMMLRRGHSFLPAGTTAPSEKEDFPSKNIESTAKKNAAKEPVPPTIAEVMRLVRWSNVSLRAQFLREASQEAYVQELNNLRDHAFKVGLVKCPTFLLHHCDPPLMSEGHPQAARGIGSSCKTEDDSIQENIKSTSEGCEEDNIMTAPVNIGFPAAKKSFQSTKQWWENYFEIPERRDRVLQLLEKYINKTFRKIGFGCSVEYDDARGMDEGLYPRICVRYMYPGAEKIVGEMLNTIFRTQLFPDIVHDCDWDSTRSSPTSWTSLIVPEVEESVRPRTVFFSVHVDLPTICSALLPRKILQDLVLPNLDFGKYEKQERLNHEDSKKNVYDVHGKKKNSEEGLTAEALELRPEEMERAMDNAIENLLRKAREPEQE